MSKSVVLMVTPGYPLGNSHRKDKKIFYTHRVVVHFMTLSEPMNAMLFSTGRAGCSRAFFSHP